MKIERLREWVQSGDVPRAKEAIRAMNVSKIARADRLPLAELAHDIYWGEKALQILYPVVRPARRLRSHTPTAAELATYGSVLVSMRRLREGLEVLGRIPKPIPFQAVNGMAWAHFRRWEWELALPALKELAARSGLSTDERIEAETSLGVAILHGTGDTAKALKLMESAGQSARAAKLTTAYESTVWMVIQAHYFAGNWPAAREALAEWRAGSISATSPRLRLRERQWEQLIALGETGDSGAFASRLQAIVREMQDMGYWDWARDCFFYLTVATKDRERMTRLFFGTSLPGMRRRLLEAFRLTTDDLPLHLDWRVGRGRPEVTLDLATGTFTKLRAMIKPGQAPHRLLCALAEDFFMGQSGPELHAKVFPGEHFNPLTSLHRLNGVIHRLRGWLETHRVPLAIVERAGYYWLDGAPVALVRVPRFASSPLDARLELLLRHFGDKEFTALDAAAALSVSRNRVLGWLRDAAAQSRVVRVGFGPTARYRLPKN